MAAKGHPVPQTLSETNGVVVRQKTQMGEAIAQELFGIPLESRNRYRVGLLPLNKVVKNAPNDPDGWEPTAGELEALEPFLFAKEESGCCTRTWFTWLGCGNLRPLRMHFTMAHDSGDVYVINREFNMGGFYCCPLEMSLDFVADGQQPVRIGRVRENFSPYFSKCGALCCLATTYSDIDRSLPDGTYETKFQLRTNVSCCGRVNNCCGGTCCKNDAVYDILDMKGEIVAHLQRTFGGGNGNCFNACCRAGSGFSNYVLEFPRDSTPEERMLLITALMQIEYQLFERSQ